MHGTMPANFLKNQAGLTRNMGGITSQQNNTHGHKSPNALTSSHDAAIQYQMLSNTIENRQNSRPSNKTSHGYSNSANQSSLHHDKFKNGTARYTQNQNALTTDPLTNVSHPSMKFQSHSSNPTTFEMYRAPTNSGVYVTSAF